MFIHSNTSAVAGGSRITSNAPGSMSSMGRGERRLLRRLVAEGDHVDVARVERVA